MGLRDLLASIGMKLGLGRALGPGSVPSEDMGGRLRESFIGLAPQQAGIEPSAAYPKAFAVAMDWPVGEQIATVVSVADGSASLYTTSSFGIVGGQGHPPIRQAAERFVAMAQSYFDGATPTTSHDYPSGNTVRFYLLGYDGVRSVDGALEAIQRGTAPLSPLFGAGQAVLTELRQLAERRG